MQLSGKWEKFLTTFFYCRIDLLILTEQLDASLIVLRRRYKWNHLDIFYKSQIVAGSRKIKFSEEAEKKLLSSKRNLGDPILYEAANETWWKQDELLESDVWEEVNELILCLIFAPPASVAAVSFVQQAGTTG